MFLKREPDGEADHLGDHVADHLGDHVADHLDDHGRVTNDEGRNTITFLAQYYLLFPY